MLQTLFHIPRELFGVPLFGFGLLLALWAVVGTLLLALGIYRHGLDAEVRGFLPILLVLGVAIAFVFPRILGPQGLPIRGYGAMLVVAIVSACALAVHRARKVGIHAEVIFSLAFWAFLGGIVTARLFYVVEYWPEFATGNPAETVLAIVNVTEGGLVIYGGILGGTVAALWFLARQRLPILAMGDLVAPSIALGLGLGRLGCFLNGCCFGGPCDLPWAVRFPAPSPPFVRQAERGQIFLHGLRLSQDFAGPAVVEAVEPDSQPARLGVRAGDQIIRINGQSVTTAGRAFDVLLHLTPGESVALTIVGKGDFAWTLPNARALSRPVHPTQLYSALDGVLLCLLLLAIHPFRRRDGETLAWLLTLHPLSRFLLEVVRIDEPGQFGTGLSIAQLISLGFLVGAAALWMYLHRQPRGTVLPEHLPATS